MLNQSQWRQFDAQGYRVLERFVDERLLQRLGAEYSELLDLLNYGPLLDVVESMWGPELAGNSIQHVRIRPPGEQLSADENCTHVSVTAWHQDRAVAHAGADQSRMLTCCAMTEADSENGCLMVVPTPVGSASPTHCAAGQAHIPDALLEQSLALALEVPRGSVVLIHPSTPHASRQNQSDRFRWSFDLRDHRMGDNSGRSHFPIFIVRSKRQKTVGDWQEMRQAWLKTRARLVAKAPISLHRWGGEEPLCA